MKVGLRICEFPRGHHAGPGNKPQPLNCSVPETLYIPLVSVVPEKLLRVPFTSNLLPLPTVRPPLLVKFSAVVKLRPPKMLKLPEGVLVASLTRASLPAASTKLAFDPFRTMLAVLITIAAVAAQLVDF